MPGISRELAEAILSRPDHPGRKDLTEEQLEELRREYSGVDISNVDPLDVLIPDEPEQKPSKGSKAPGPMDWKKRRMAAIEKVEG